MPRSLEPRSRRRASAGRLAAIVVAVAALASAGVQVVRGARAHRAARALEREVPRERVAGYAGSASCRSCHPAEHASWHASYHRTMTQRATPDALIDADAFAPRVLHGPDGDSRVERRGDELWVELVDPVWKLEHLDGPLDPDAPPLDAPTVWRRVLLITGSHNMQVYWVAAESRRKLHAFPFAYLLDEPDEDARGPGRWVPNESTLLRPPLEGGVYTWNHVCIKCHAVAGQPGLAREDAGRVETRVGEFGIACESCHGPAAEHARRHRDPVRRYRAHIREDREGDAPPPGEPVNPARLDHARASEVCGQCHGITRFYDDADWRDHGSEFTPGRALTEAMRAVRHPALEDQPWMDAEVDATPDFFAQRFWPDGMVRVGGREYNGLLESPCYQRGELSCLSCHALHDSDPRDQLAAGMGGDDACLQCHAELAPADRRAAHTHHAPGSSGAACYSCHQPHTTYGLLKAMRSHQISSPSIEESTRHGRPNACNLCHLDRTLAWSMEHLEKWYGIAPVALDDDERVVAGAPLWALKGDAGQRALIAWHLGWEDARAATPEGWRAPLLARLLNDPYPAVRIIAGRALQRVPGFEDFAYDAVGDPGHRASAPAAVEERWRALGGAHGLDAPALLLPGGELDLAAVGRLTRARDNRPVTLAE
ncbi:MAG: hypothetical protein H6713_27660 [Myxococcales bacterium]|nr:hypothetical protein [Myxococcales bacterium]